MPDLRLDRVDDQHNSSSPAVSAGVWPAQIHATAISEPAKTKACGSPAWLPNSDSPRKAATSIAATVSIRGQRVAQRRVGQWTEVDRTCARAFGRRDRLTAARRAYVPSQQRLKIGHITPSSNTVLEPMTACITAEVEDRVSQHYTRVRVESITLQERHTSQFTPERMLEAARLLADAGVDAIAWNGTSGAWNGVEADHEICALIEHHTGIPATTSTLAQFDAMTALGVSRYGLAVPYTDDVTERIVEVYGHHGWTCTGTANEGISTNREMAFLAPDRVRELVRVANDDDAECILVICTGVAAADLVEELEQELGKPIVDSVSVVVWKTLQMVGAPPRLTGWGSLLAGEALTGAAPPPIRPRAQTSMRDPIVIVRSPGSAK